MRNLTRVLTLLTLVAAVGLSGCFWARDGGYRGGGEHGGEHRGEGEHGDRGGDGDRH